VKWVGPAAVAIVLATLLLRASAGADNWTSIEFGGSAQSRAIALVLHADASVRGWTRWSRPALLVSCTPSGDVRLTVATGLHVDVESGLIRTVSLQFDDERSTIARWSLESDRETLTAPAADASRLVARMVSARRFNIAFIPLHAEPVVARFSVSGFARHWGGTASGCTP
jgi:hypothetical protein